MPDYPGFIRQAHFIWHSKQVESKAKNYLQVVFDPAIHVFRQRRFDLMSSLNDWKPLLKHTVQHEIYHLILSPVNALEGHFPLRNNETRFILLCSINRLPNDYFLQKVKQLKVALCKTKLSCKDKETIWTVSTMSCLWKLIKFSVIMWDGKNGTKMSIKICVATRPCAHCRVCTLTAE